MTIPVTELSAACAALAACTPAESRALNKISLGQKGWEEGEEGEEDCSCRDELMGSWKMEEEASEKFEEDGRRASAM